MVLWNTWISKLGPALLVTYSTNCFINYYCACCVSIEVKTTEAFEALTSTTEHVIAGGWSCCLRVQWHKYVFSKDFLLMKTVRWGRLFFPRLVHSVTHSNSYTLELLNCWRNLATMSELSAWTINKKGPLIKVTFVNECIVIARSGNSDWLCIWPV